MEAGGIDQAIARIGVAVARLERATDRALFSQTPSGDATLAARHEALRGRVGAALGELDKLIAELER